MASGILSLSLLNRPCHAEGQRLTLPRGVGALCGIAWNHSLLLCRSSWSLREGARLSCMSRASQQVFQSPYSCDCCALFQVCFTSQTAVVDLVILGQGQQVELCWALHVSPCSKQSACKALGALSSKPHHLLPVLACRTAWQIRFLLLYPRNKKTTGSELQGALDPDLCFKSWSTQNSSIPAAGHRTPYLLWLP